MSIPLLALVMVIYLGVAVSMAQAGRWGMALVYAAYALGNVGFILDIWTWH